MTSPTAGPRCPRCHRPLAAWRLEHCIYCGEAFPAELKEGFAEPEGLKWVERPVLPPDVSKKLELMRIVPSEGNKAGTALAVGSAIGSGMIAVIFLLAYAFMRRISPTSSLIFLFAGLVALGFLAVTFFRGRKRAAPTGPSSGSGPPRAR